MLTEPWGFIHRVMVYSGQGHDIPNTMSHTEYVVFKLRMDYFMKADHYLWTIIIIVSIYQNCV